LTTDYPLSFDPERRQMRIKKQTTRIDVNWRLMKSSTAQEPVGVDETPEIRTYNVTQSLHRIFTLNYTARERRKN